MSADCLSNEQYPLPNFELVADAALLGGHGSKLRSSLSHREHSPVYINDCLHSGPHPLWSTSGEAAEQSFSDLPFLLEETKLRLTRNGSKEHCCVTYRRKYCK